MQVELIDNKEKLYLCKDLESGSLFKDSTTSKYVYMKIETGYVGLENGTYFKVMDDDYYVIKLKQLEPLKVERI
jgi:hypothetical protein